MTWRANLSHFWFNIKNNLFPELKNSLGILTPEYEKLVTILEFIRIEEHVKSTFLDNLGRKQRDRSRIARSFVAKCVLKITYTKQLVDRLKSDEQLRLICGWESHSKIPSESKFSRVFKEFAEDKLAEKVHKALIEMVYKDQLVGHITKDSTPIESREKPLKKKGTAEERKAFNKKQRKIRQKSGELSLREKQLIADSVEEMLIDIPTQCDIGAKKNGQGLMKSWKGYKLHSAVDDHCIPIATVITSASVVDSEVAIPLASKASEVVTNLYDLMDAAYDQPEIKEHSKRLGHVPIIDKCPSSKKQKEEKETEKKAKKMLNFRTAEDERYAERMPKERFNASFKDFYGGSNIFYRGFQKVSSHLMFGVLTLAASMIIKLIN